jgi:hypothetical protein
MFGFDPIGDIKKAASDFGQTVSGAAEGFVETVTGAAQDVAKAGETIIQEVAKVGETVVHELAKAGETVVQEAGEAAVALAGVGTGVAGPIAEIIVGARDAAEGAPGGDAPVEAEPTPAGPAAQSPADDALKRLTELFDKEFERQRKLAEQRPYRRAEFFVEPGENAAGASIPLKPGEETEVTVTVDTLRPNAKVREITAVLLVADATSVPPPEPTVAEVNRSSEEEPEQVAVKVQTPRRPRNVAIRLAGGNVFWTHATPLTDDEYLITDFSAAVNAYLDAVNVEGVVVPLRFLVRSDTPGRVGIVISPAAIRASLLKTQTWTNDLDGTIHVDRGLTLDYGTVEEVALGPVEVRPADGRATLLSVSFDVSGTVGAERMLGAVSGSPSREFASISTDYAVAQRFTASADLRSVGVTALLLAEQAARVYVELQRDAGGAPEVAPPLAGAELALAATPPGVWRWSYAAFERPASMTAGGAYWVVLRAVQGTAHVALEPTGLAFDTGAVVNRGGALWRGVAGPGNGPSAMLRVVFAPDARNELSALEVRLALANGGTGAALPLARRRVEPRGAAQTIALSLPMALAATPLKLVVHSHARGTVTLANVTQEYSVT